MIAVPTWLVLCPNAHLLLNYSAQLLVFLFDGGDAFFYFFGEFFHRCSVEELIELEGISDTLNSAVFLDLLLLVVLYQCHVVELINLRLLLTLSLQSLQLLMLFLASDCVLELAESLLAQDGLVLDDIVIGIFVLIHLHLQ